MIGWATMRQHGELSDRQGGRRIRLRRQPHPKGCEIRFVVHVPAENPKDVFAQLSLAGHELPRHRSEKRPCSSER
jgi:hypothetical protein